MKHTILLKVRNNAGVMMHVVSLFSRRGYNIESIAVGTREDPRQSIITIIVDDNNHKDIIRQIDKQLSKLVDVISIKDFQYNESLNRELVLMLLEFGKEELGVLIELVNAFGGRVEDMTEETMLVEMSGISRKVKSFIDMVSKKYKILEIVRTGQIALPYQSKLKDARIL